MGIQGLKTFLEQYNRKYSESLLVRNQYLVIDGSNLQYFIYFKESRNNFHLFGGDFNLYANSLRSFFTELRQCLITPVVIVDGSLETEKMNTVLKRFLQWLKVSLKIDGKYPTAGKHNHSVWMSVIFHEVLAEMNILQMQTEWDADDTIALFAKFLQCPILSFDSDFYIYEGVSVISLEKIFFKNRFSVAERIQMNVSSKRRISAMFSRVLNVMKMWETEFNILDIRMLSLMAAMLGNDYIPTGTFNRILYRIGGWHENMKSREKIELAMKWLKKQTSFDLALSEMLTCVPIENRQHVYDMIIFVMKSYLGEKGETAVLERLKVALRITTASNDLPKEFSDEELSDEENVSDSDHGIDEEMSHCESLLEKTTLVEDDDEEGEGKHDEDPEDVEDEIGKDIVIVAHDTKVPEWFLELHYKCLMPAYLLKIAYNHAVFLYPQLELEHLPSSHAISVPIIQITAGIILGKDSIVLVTRDNSRVAKIIVPTVTKLWGFNLPCVLLSQKMSFTETIRVEGRQKIILASLELTEHEIKFLRQWPKSAHLIVACILFFVKKVKTPSAVASALAALICLIDPQHAEEPASSSENWRVNETKDISIWFNEIPGKTSRTKYFYKKMDYKPDTWNYVFRDSYDKEKVYDYTQLKNVLYHTTMLNKLLGNPFRAANVTQLNCYMIYNIIVQIVQTEYRFMDFADKSFDGGRLHLIKEFVTFICKENQIHLNGYFKKSKKPEAKIEKKTEIKPSGSGVRNKNTFALLLNDGDSD